MNLNQSLLEQVLCKTAGIRKLADITQNQQGGMPSNPDPASQVQTQPDTNMQQAGQGQAQPQPMTFAETYNELTQMLAQVANGLLELGKQLPQQQMPGQPMAPAQSIAPAQPASMGTGAQQVATAPATQQTV